MPAPKYISIAGPKITVCYKEAVYEFNIADIDMMYVAKKNIPYHAVIRVILLLLLGPLIVYCLKADSLYVTSYCILGYCCLYAAHDIRSYKLCILTKEGIKTTIAIQRSEKKDFVEEVVCFLEDYHCR